MTTIEKTLRWIVIGGIFLLPLVPTIVTTSLFFPYITGKNFTFRIVVEIISVAWLALALINAEYRPRRSWIFAAMAVFLLIIAIADLQGVNPFKSIWSNFERMDGWVTIAHLFAYTIVAASVLKTMQLWRRLFLISLGVSVLLSLYGFLQIVGLTAIGQGTAAGLSARIDATFGNPIYLAVYMLFHVFIAAMLWAQDWVERKEYRLILSWGYGAVILIDTIALFFTGTRGTTLGLVGGAFLTALLVLLQANKSRTAWRASVAGVAAIVVLVGGFYFVRNTTAVHNIGFLNRLATISTSDTTIKARFLNAGIAWQGVKERPLLGWGQENYAIVFDKYYDPRMYADEPWFDRVHDIIFDWWIAGGTLGLLSYLSIFAATLWILWRSRGFTIAERSILTGLLAGYFVHNLTVFDNVTSYILFGTILAYIAYRSTSADNARAFPKRISIPQTAQPYVVLVAVLALWGLAWGVNEKALAANRTLLAALQPQQTGLMTNLKSFEAAINYGSFGTQEAREQLSQGAAQVAQATTATVADKQAFYDAANREMNLQASSSPLDARFPLFLGVVDDAFGDYKNAGIALEKAHELSPRKQTIDFELAQNALAQGDTTRALAILKEAYDLAPDFTDARLFYAAAAIRAGQDSLAEELLSPITQSGQAADQRILGAYVARKEYAKAVPLWIAAIKADPTNLQAYFTLAALYYTMGDRADAIKSLQAAEAAVPSVKAQADPLIQQIQNGSAQVIS